MPRSVPGAGAATVKRWLHEPLLQFLVIGVLLFVAYSFVSSRSVKSQNPSRIELTEDDLHQLDAAFTAQWLRHPTDQEMGHLIDERIREEVLYREALALGLDKDDTIVKRRLAQKMEFLAEDVSALREPNINELRNWIAKHSERFALPSRICFITSTFHLIARAIRQARPPLVRTSNWPESRLTLLWPKEWQIRSCSRTTMPIAPKIRSPRLLD